MSERTHKKSNWSSTTPQQDSALKLRRFITKDDKDEEIQQSPDINLSKFSLPTNSPFPDSNIQRQEIEGEKEEGEETPGAQLKSDKTTSEEPEEEIQTKSEELNQEIDEAVQTKLTVGQPGDKYEQEADTVAAKVVEQINSPQTNQSVQGKFEPVVKPTVMRQGGGVGGAVNQDVEQNIQQARGSGQGLAENVRQPMEQAFGADFSGVKVHTDGQADVLNRSLNSRAFATGQDIFFKQGEYQPGSKQGQELLAHELTHVVQQGGGLKQVQRQEKAKFEESTIEITEADCDEFNLLKNRTGKKDKEGSKGKEKYIGFDNVKDYVDYRNSNFGGRTKYNEIKTLADNEWEQNQVIRRRVGQGVDSEERKKALYRWLRLEYRKAGFDTTQKIVKLMQRGMTPELEKIIKDLKNKHPNLRFGGFLARPKKNSKIGYRLGTLSEHGTGKAIDIKPQDDNPQISSKDWKFIEKLVNRSINRSIKQWQEKPEQLWQDVHDLNKDFQAKVNSKIDKIKDDHNNSISEEEAFKIVLKDSSWLLKRVKKKGKQGLSFFNLEKELVKEMGNKGLKWGVTFPTPDLHHFELTD